MIMALSWKKISLVAILVLSILCQSALAQRGPGKRRGGGKRLKRLRRAAGDFDYKLLFQADLSLKRLLLAQAVSDADSSIAELDTARQVLQRTETWINSQGPDWNNQESQTALGNVDEALKFVELRLQAEFGLVDDLEQRLAHFLDQDYPPDQKIAVLLFAADSQSDRGQLKQAHKSLQRAQVLAQGRTVSPVLLYALTTEEMKLRFLGGQSLTKQELLEGCERALSALVSYQPKARPLQDVHWLVARNVTPFWTSQLQKLGPDGTQKLEQMLATFRLLKSATKKPWNKLQLEQQGIIFPYDGYVKHFADWVMASSFADQMLKVVEALPSENQKQALPLDELQELGQTLQRISSKEVLFTNQKLGPEYLTFPIGESGLIPELQGRVELLKAGFQELNARPPLFSQGWEQIKKSDDLPKKLAYGLTIARYLNGPLDSPRLGTPILEETLSSASSYGLPQITILSLAELAQVYADSEEWSQAGLYADRCLKEIEQAIPLTGGSSSLALELQKLSSAMTSISAQAALSKDDAPAALSALTQGQSYETAVSQLGANKKAAQALKEVEEKKQQVAILTQKVDQLKALPASETRDELLADSEKLLAETRSDFLLESRRIRQEHSELYSSVLRFDPLNLPDIQSSLSADTAVIQYFPTEEQLYLFVVTNKNLKLRSIKTKKADLEKDTRLFTRSLSRLAPLESVISKSQGLYRILVAPVENDLVEAQRLVIIPSGHLNFVPFGALYDENKQPLIKKHSFLELAKPTDFIRIAQSKPAAITSVTAFANATLDLPATSLEGREIVSLFDSSQLFEGNEATKARFLDQGNRQQALHLATHGHWDTKNSLNNYLELAKGERVAQEEILALALQNTALVTLSACNTAVASTAESDYVASLAEAFWLAGCPTVVASLWAVEDRSTGRLMTNFYAGLKEGKSKVKALRDAQLELIDSKEFEHPTYWSGFVLFGDWR